TGASTQLPLPAGTKPHFVNVGPDGNVWFTSLNDQIGTVDLATGAVTFFSEGITPGSVPHVILPGPDGNLYFTEQASEPDPDPLGRGRIPGNGRLARFDLATHTVTEFSAGLPTGNRLHGLAVGPDGNLWVTLGGVDQVARFNLATETFDRFLS